MCVLVKNKDTQNLKFKLESKALVFLFSQLINCQLPQANCSFPSD